MRLKIAVSVVRFRPWAPFRAFNVLLRSLVGARRKCATSFAHILHELRQSQPLLNREGLAKPHMFFTSASRSRIFPLVRNRARNLLGWVYLRVHRLPRERLVRPATERRRPNLPCQTRCCRGSG